MSVYSRGDTHSHQLSDSLCAAAWFSNYLPEAQEVDRALPTLFILAESSADTAKRYLKQHLPNADHAVFGGHVMFWEQPGPKGDPQI